MRLSIKDIDYELWQTASGIEAAALGRAYPMLVLNQPQPPESAPVSDAKPEGKEGVVQTDRGGTFHRCCQV